MAETRRGVSLRNPYEVVLGILGYDVRFIGQEWFWTPGWQAREAQADADFAAGRSRVFTSVDDLFADLDADDE